MFSFNIFHDDSLLVFNFNQRYKTPISPDIDITDKEYRFTVFKLIYFLFEVRSSLFHNLSLSTQLHMFFVEY